jgi:hypothetical protein
MIVEIVQGLCWMAGAMIIISIIAILVRENNE